ncbi:MAG: ribulose-phosphate 3-epimerase [Candidatus Spyradocola sp.]
MSSIIPGVSPSMMCADALNLGADAVALEKAGVQYFHYDVMDGDFVPNFMLGPDVIKAVRKVSKVPADIHLMVKNPERHLHLFDLREGDVVSVHQESTIHLQRTLAAIRQAGAQAAVALNPATPLCTIEDVLPDVDMVLMMTVNPGFAGQKLVPQTLQKITRLRKMLDESGYAHVRIEVDGNVSFENAVKMRAAGADLFVAGTSAVFRDGGIEANMARLLDCIR